MAASLDVAKEDVKESTLALSSECDSRRLAIKVAIENALKASHAEFEVIKQKVVDSTLTLASIEEAS